MFFYEGFGLFSISFQLVIFMKNDFMIFLGKDLLENNFYKKVPWVLGKAFL